MRKAVDLGPVEAAAIRTASGKIRVRFLFTTAQLEAMLAEARADDAAEVTDVTDVTDVTPVTPCNAPKRESQRREDSDGGGGARATPPVNMVFGCWSREWWGCLLARADRGEPLWLMVSKAIERAGDWTERSDRMPDAEQLEALISYPSDGPQIATWRPWFEQRGAKLPDWRSRIWVFLPGPEPPPDGQPALGAGSDKAASRTTRTTEKRA